MGKGEHITTHSIPTGLGWCDAQTPLGFQGLIILTQGSTYAGDTLRPILFYFAARFCFPAARAISILVFVLALTPLVRKFDAALSVARISESSFQPVLARLRRVRFECLRQAKAQFQKAQGVFDK